MFFNLLPLPMRQQIQGVIGYQAVYVIYVSHIANLYTGVKRKAQNVTGLSLRFTLYVLDYLTVLQ